MALASYQLFLANVDLVSDITIISKGVGKSALGFIHVKSLMTRFLTNFSPATPLQRLLQIVSANIYISLTIFL